MQIVQMLWAHIPVSVELDILEADKLAMVRIQPTNKLKNKGEMEISDVNIQCNNALILFSKSTPRRSSVM